VKDKNDPDMRETIQGLEGFDALKCRFDGYKGPGFGHQAGLAGDSELFFKTGSDMGDRFKCVGHGRHPICELSFGRDYLILTLSLYQKDGKRIRHFMRALNQRRHHRSAITIRSLP
jgi:hypothetical protein